MKNILLLGCGGAAAHNFVKSLRNSFNEYRIIGTDLNKYQLKASNVDIQYLLPEHKTHQELTNKINDIIFAWSIDLVHAQPDLMVKRLAIRREQIGAPTFLPCDSSIAISQSKIATNQILLDAAVPVPYSCRISCLGQLRKTFKRVKKNIEGSGENSDLLWIRAEHGAGSKAALPVHTQEQINFWIDYWSTKGLYPYDFMLCEFLPGPEYAWQSLWNEGELVTSIARERIEYVFGHLMPSGQSSSPSVARIVHNDEVNQIGESAVRAISPAPHGVFGVDMKTSSNGHIKVTEINAGRFYTTNDFYAAAGINIVDMYAQIAVGNPVKNVSRTNPVAENQYWIRAMDRGPYLWKQN